MKPIRHLELQRGLTLIELLVALGMGLMLLAGVAAVFVANKETFRVQEALAASQENGRFALSTITRDLRASGYWGCSSVPGSIVSPGAPLVTLTSPAGSQFINFSRAVFGFDGSSGSWSPTLDSHFSTLASGRQPVVGSDVLLVRVLDANENRVILHSSPADPITISGATNLVKDDIAMISKCDGAAIFALTADPSGGVISHGKNLKFTFQPPPPSPVPPDVVLSAQVQQIRNRAYYVAPSTGDAARQSLWRWDGRDPGAFPDALEEVVQGVERLEVRFGIDTTGGAGDGSVDEYRTAAEIESSGSAGAFWDRVQSVRVTLVMASNERGVAPSSYSYLLDVNSSSVITPTSPTDTRLRQVFSATTAVRNRQS